jgi:hypothetical protein
VIANDLLHGLSFWFARLVNMKPGVVADLSRVGIA